MARKPIVLMPNAGRAYDGGPVRAIFKADGDETKQQYSLSEWWLEPYTKGPGAHAHDEDDVFYVIEGTMSFFVGGEWIDAPKGSLVIAPGGTAHDFENRTAQRAGMLNVSVPGGFEPEMDGISAWFRERPAEDARTANAPRVVEHRNDEK
jgi:mannose-6-phosphate isomerase-like protein (cupin superfamily)